MNYDSHNYDDDDDYNGVSSNGSIFINATEAFSNLGNFCGRSNGVKTPK